MLIDNVTPHERTQWIDVLQHDIEGWRIDPDVFCSNPSTPEYLFFYGQGIGLFFYVFTRPDKKIFLSFGVFQQDQDGVALNEQFVDQFTGGPQEVENLLKALRVYRESWKDMIDAQTTNKTHIPLWKRNNA